ncbi:MAG TPA: cysteine synthase [Kofleriaceae bacterium]|nr:cysteine synthase [Kofleriaceae bacterium]
MARYENILGTVGRTPVVKVRKLSPPGVTMYVKLESFNPMASVKDRLALGVIEAAERSGALKPGQTVVEATSGNTGIGLAMVCAQKGYPLVIVMGENFSVERRKMMRYLGAKVVLTPASLRGVGMLGKAVELAETHGWFLCRQFENEANADIHSQTTAQEILEDFAGDRLDYWVTGFGTGGTLKGVARVLKEHRPGTQIVVCEPDNSQILGSGVAQPRHPDGKPAGSHPISRPHPLQGIGPDFVPKLTDDAVTARLIDRLVPVNGGEAMRCARELARQEGIFCGMSAGAAFAAALEVARTAPAGSTILAMLPDTGERYLSTPMFGEVGAEMSAEEDAIAKSTPNFRFDVPPPPAPAAPLVEPTPDDVEFVEAAIRDTASPVVLFALEWCEFCWSVRRMLARHGIPYRAIDLDSVQYQRDNHGGRIRAALTAKTKMTTIPQLFVGETFIGGATDTFDAYKAGRLQQLLVEHRVAYDTSVNIDPYSFLPTWLHPR